MKTFFVGIAVAATLLGGNLFPAAAQDNDTSAVVYDNLFSTPAYDAYPYSGVAPITVTGRVVSVNIDGDRMIVRSDRHRRYMVDTYNAEMISPSDANDSVSNNIEAGERVRVVGRLLGVHFVEAGRVTVLHDAPAPRLIEPEPEPAPAPAPVVAPPPPVVHETVTVDGVISRVAADQGELSVITANDHVYTVQVGDADIIVPGQDRAGTMADLTRGAHIRLIGDRDGVSVPEGVTAGDIVRADRIRILSAEPVAAPAPASAAAVLDLSSYTGILIDVRGFRRIQRSPNPSIYDSDRGLLYPDRSHVPTPDEVQEESTVRYYRSVDDAMAGVGGAHPLILQAVEVVGPAEDGVMLSPDETALFKALDQRLGYSRNWKVGFLIPSDR